MNEDRVRRVVEVGGVALLVAVVWFGVATQDEPAGDCPAFTVECFR